MTVPVMTRTRSVEILAPIYCFATTGRKIQFKNVGYGKGLG